MRNTVLLSQDYGSSVAKYMALAIICAVLNFLGTLFYFCGRCICRLRCCGAKPRETPYHALEIALPMFFFSVFAIGMVATGGQANHGNGKVTSAIGRTFDTIDHGAQDMQHFFGIAKRPLEGIQDTVSDAVVEAQGIIASTGWVGDDMQGIVSASEASAQI